ncbi:MULTISPECIES: hypothetical protein [unclassified Shewanella]|uniref:hypothetical protein n=1 Tax=unclassified Shewanella TaxID=196818 RepID=UPI0021DABDFA|nr:MULTISPECIES: hypothetical protein [unclassified Shewanella]MCU7998096.1 hypothetical protein [Shewanella sp. SM95]MCU8008471.1 hypothetical protein [Shewanella sp. SM87]
MRMISISLALFMLGGCATSAVNIDIAKEVPEERLFVKNTDGNATITIIRDSGLLGSACNINVFINEDLAATLGTSEKAVFKVKAGDLYLGAQFSGNGLCVNSSIRNLETSIKQGQHKTYRVYSDPSGNMQILAGSIIKS